jgi:hypothetical protein
MHITPGAALYRGLSLLATAKCAPHFPAAMIRYVVWHAIPAHRSKGMHHPFPLTRKNMNIDAFLFVF